MQQFENIWERKNKPRPALDIKEIYEYDLDSTPEELDEYCQKADFVFNLAGVNRPENPEDFMKGNFGFASELLNCLKKNNNKVTIMFPLFRLFGRPLRQQRVWSQQEGRRGAVHCGGRSWTNSGAKYQHRRNGLGIRSRLST